MRRLQCLDGMRGVLAAYVMVSHMVWFSIMPGWIVGPLSHGGAGVDAFFILSGLVIVQSLQAHHWERRRFLVARAVRIFPVFLVVFAAAVGVQTLDRSGHRLIWDLLPWLGPDAFARNLWSTGWPNHWLASIAAHLTMTHGLFPDAVLPDVWVDYLGPAWSLSSEWQFYAVAALAASWLGRAGFGRAGFGRGRLGEFAGALLLLGVAGTAWQAVAPDGLTFSRAFLPNKAHYFALGVASAALLRETAAGRPLMATRAWFAVVLAGTLLLCLLEGKEKLAVPIVWVAVLAAQTWPRQTGTGWLAWLLTRPAILWLGAISYPLYLAHVPVQKLYIRGLAMAVHSDPFWFTALLVPGSLVLPVGVAWLLHIGVERPAMRRFGRPAFGMTRAASRPASGLGVAPAGGDALCAAPKWTNPIRSAGSRIPMSRSRTG